MRVIAGIAKGRQLKTVPGDSTRPIMDRARTALFDTLRPELSGTRFLDLFAGTGSVGIEALSQGAEHCTFTDIEARAIAVIKENLEITGLAEKARVKHLDAFRFLKACKESFDIIYIAPPQYKNFWEQALLMIVERPDLVSQGGLIIVQIDPKEYEELQLSNFSEERQKRYGNTLIIFYRKNG